MNREFVLADARYTPLICSLQPKKPTVVVTYSHRDERPWKEYVVGHLKVAETQGVFRTWNDRRIRAGKNWRAEIDSALAKAKVGIILVSHHMLTSDFILDHEVPAILNWHVENGLLVYPIVVRDCDWAAVDWLKAMNLRPSDGRPLNSFRAPQRDTVMADICREIREALGQLV